MTRALGNTLRFIKEILKLLVHTKQYNEITDFFKTYFWRDQLRGENKNEL